MDHFEYMVIKSLTTSRGQNNGKDWYRVKNVFDMVLLSVTDQSSSQ